MELFHDAVEEHDAAEEEEFMEQMHEDRQDDEYETFCNEDNWDRSDDDEAPSNKPPLKQPKFQSSEYVPIAALRSRETTVASFEGGFVPTIWHGPKKQRTDQTERMCFCQW